MRISELARRGGVTTATAKYYLREGLLPPGRLTSATQAQYDEPHVQRLRLTRALLASGLSVATAREVLGHLDSPADGPLDLLAEVQTTLTPVEGPVDRERVTALLRRWGWNTDVALDGPVAALASALDVAEAAGFTIGPELLDGYAAAAHEVAELDIAGVPTTSSEDAVQHVVLGTILLEPVLLALRRLAQADVSARRFG
ncbi:MerR family transcriptional regulator [Aeromicrobium yanjiei]|uniref:MerR family transcriptional regulator n=1 Tax=Aeromicrobium yanjiei TaxID=2662028 RepID=A0A5Q2MA63_9ACTN|nr:MerR family transcriptional regulator [Aeromicrobium yanjiei]QGG39994.1 MerR family transcriptional regulator [Aeromicrobium yanjiei]